jgi:hypothetical protein
MDHNENDLTIINLSNNSLYIKWQDFNHNNNTVIMGNHEKNFNIKFAMFWSF